MIPVRPGSKSMAEMDRSPESRTATVRPVLCCIHSGAGRRDSARCFLRETRGGEFQWRLGGDRSARQGSLSRCNFGSFSGGLWWGDGQHGLYPGWSDVRLLPEEIMEAGEMVQ